MASSLAVRSGVLNNPMSLRSRAEAEPRGHHPGAEASQYGQHCKEDPVTAARAETERGDHTDQRDNGHQQCQWLCHERIPYGDNLAHSTRVRPPGVRWITGRESHAAVMLATHGEYISEHIRGGKMQRCGKSNDAGG